MYARTFKHCPPICSLFTPTAGTTQVTSALRSAIPSDARDSGGRGSGASTISPLATATMAPLAMGSADCVAVGPELFGPGALSEKHERPNVSSRRVSSHGAENK